jgi:Zn-dependent M28 family amino/carboxypeptidase
MGSKTLRILGLGAVWILGSSCGTQPAPPPPAETSPTTPQNAQSSEKNDWKADLDHSELQSIIEFLASDLLEGRAPGTRGGRIAEEYIQSLFKLWGIAPASKDGYFQPFDLNGYSAEDLQLDLGGVALHFSKDNMGAVLSNEPNPVLEGEAVFVGFGIATPLWDWDDFKDVDVTDKIIITRLNDPGLFLPEIFEGKVLTYFGRWTYHVEEAIRRGAKGILIIHTDETAGYTWNVVENSWSGEKVRLDQQVDNNLKLQAWVKEQSLKRALEARGIDLEELYKASLQKDFRPVELGFTIKAKSKLSHRRFPTNNVVAMIPGQSDKQVVLSAHIDHLGIGKEKDGDNIFNGAIDNGSALASMMLVAKHLKNMRNELYYSYVFLACNAEEGGLLGSKYYVDRADKSKIIANINFESTPVWEKAGSLMGVGARFSTFEDMIKQVASRQGLAYSEFSLSDQGLFYRSDQFPFAAAGIPAVWISAGEDDASGQQKYTAFWSGAYHTVDDEYDPNWKLESMAQTVQATLGLLQIIDEERQEPVWKENITFPIHKE